MGLTVSLEVGTHPQPLAFHCAKERGLFRAWPLGVFTKRLSPSPDTHLFLRKPLRASPSPSDVVKIRERASSSLHKERGALKTRWQRSALPGGLAQGLLRGFTDPGGV